MEMTLKQAFTMWANEPGNISLAARSREAVNKVLMKKYNDVELVQFTASLAERIFEQSKEVQELKSKAASVLVHVLNYGAEKGWCSKPTFTYEIARPMTAGRAPEQEGQDAAERIPTGGPENGADLPASESGESTPPTNPCDGCNNMKGCITCVDGDQRAVITVAEPKQESDMEEKRQRGKQPKPVVQIDPKTLQVIREWPSMSEATRELGLSHLDVAVAKLRKCGGFYWSLASDADTFQERLVAKTKDASRKAADKANAGKNPMKLSHPKYTYFVQTKEEIERTARKVEGDMAKINAQAALGSLTDEELLEELGRRGWEGDVSRVQRATIGKNREG